MAILSKGTTFSDGDQLTSDSLNNLVDNSTFASDAVDDSTTQLSSGKIIVKDLGVSTGKLAASAVTTAKIAGSNVTTAKIAAANITTSLIADSNVTKAKIENLADYKVLGNVSGGAAAPAEVAILDEDNMSSNSATSLATQQSIKAYVDTQLTAEDLDFAGDSGSSSVDLDGQTFTIAGATGLDTAASGQTLTVSLDLNELATETSIAQDDFLAMVDNTDSGNGKITFSNLEDQIFGNVSGSVAIAAGGAATVSAVTVADESSDTTCFPLFATAATGSLGPKSGSNLTFNSSTGLLTATTLSGILANGVTGTTQSSGDNSTNVATTAYVDAQVATSDALSEVLAVGNTTGSTNIVVSNGQSITTNTIAETTSGSGVTVDSLLIKDGGITAAGTSTFAGQTISNLGTVTTANIDGGSIDGTAIGANSASTGVFTTVTASGEIDGGSLDISGNTDIDGVTTLNSTAQLNSTLTVGINGNGHDVKFFGDTSGAYIQFDASADKLLTAGGATVDIVKDKLLIGGTAVTTTAAELNILDGVTSTTAELNILDGVTSTAAELNYLDITTLGTSQASKAVTVDSSGDLLVPDSDKFKFGTGSDMQVYHDGTNSYIANSTGELKIATETSGIAIAIGHSTSEATFGDNVTITGNLTVNGTTTTVNTTNLTVTDPLVKFGEGYPGSAFDEGFIVTRGNGAASNTANKGFIWDETADEFAAIACNTEDGTTAGNVTINSYADLQVGKLTGGSLDISGAIDVLGTTNLDVVDIDGAVQIDSTLTVGVDDTGHDVKFFGATSGAYMHWDESTDDLILAGASKLGIGTTAPNSKLTIVGDDAETAAINTATATTLEVAGNGTSSNSGGAVVFSAASGAWKFAAIKGLAVSGTANTTGDLAFSTRNATGDSTLTERMRIKYDGNVGIGDTSPSYKLDVNGTGRFTDAVRFDGNTNNYAGAYDINRTGGGYLRHRIADQSLSIGVTNTAGTLHYPIVMTPSSDILQFKNEEGEMARFDTSGNLGIGDTSPSEKLSVTGNAEISGSISKGSGSFKIPHPLKSKEETHNLVHSFLEGPQADLLYRGRVNLVDGVASVNIDVASDMTDGTFVVLCRDVQSFTTNESGWTAVRSSVDGNILTIEAQDNTCTDSISWMVVGERQDDHMMNTGWTDENGKVIVEPLIPEPTPEPEEEEITEEE